MCPPNSRVSPTANSPDWVKGQQTGSDYEGTAPSPEAQLMNNFMNSITHAALTKTARCYAVQSMCPSAALHFGASRPNW